MPENHTGNVSIDVTFFVHADVAQFSVNIWNAANTALWEAVFGAANVPAPALLFFEHNPGGQTPPPPPTSRFANPAAVMTWLQSPDGIATLLPLENITALQNVNTVAGMQQVVIAAIDALIAAEVARHIAEDNGIAGEAWFVARPATAMPDLPATPPGLANAPAPVWIDADWVAAVTGSPGIPGEEGFISVQFGITGTPDPAGGPGNVATSATVGPVFGFPFQLDTHFAGGQRSFHEGAIVSALLNQFFSEPVSGTRNVTGSPPNSIAVWLNEPGGTPVAGPPDNIADIFNPNGNGNIITAPPASLLQNAGGENPFGERGNENHAAVRTFLATLEAQLGITLPVTVGVTGGVDILLEAPIHGTEGAPFGTAGSLRLTWGAPWLPTVITIPAAPFLAPVVTVPT